MNKYLRDKFIEVREKDTKPTQLQMLTEMIEDIMSLSIPVITEESAPAPKVRTYNISEIPMIPISELGWANADDDVDTDDPNAPPSQRRGLEQYLSKIPGTGFADKLNDVSNIMEKGIGSLSKENPKEFIQQAMAYLVFYKTLTMAITNFNASAAGFNFEAFLAALMDGKQIPASGAKTIADITANVDGERVPISLKLYTDKGLEVGGSFFDLCNDMLEPNGEWAGWVGSNPEFEGGAMRYIACTKTLSGDGIEQEGHIDFYQFDITRKNLFELLSVTDAGRKAILSNSTFMAAVTEYMRTGEASAALNWADEIPARSDTSDSAEISSLWSDYLSNADLSSLRAIVTEEQQLKQIVDAVLRLYIQSIESTQNANALSTPAGALKVGILSVLNPEVKATNHQHPDSKKAAVIRDVFLRLFGQFKKEVIRTRDARGQFLDKSGEWVTGAPVVEWYNSLTPELKAMAIKNTKGYLTRGHWVLSRGATIKLGGGTPFAKLQIGARYVINVLESARGELMDEVFGIFDQVAQMSAKLNAFFANGLSQPDEAKDAAVAADNVGTDTRKIADVNE
tara:strand:+ start:10470 stop:12173 length:1704 start_codon:yes stop_codon:yes gene_type:complete